MGIQPGLTNIMAARCARQLDSVREYQLGWPLMWLGNAWQLLTPMQWRNDPAESLEFVRKFRGNLEWQLNAMVEKSTGHDGMVTTFSGGEWRRIDPVDAGIQAPAGNGGTALVYPYGSGSLYLPGALPFSATEVVQLSISPFPAQTNDLVRQNARKIGAGEIDVPTAVDVVFAAIESAPERWLTAQPDDEIPPGLWVAAVGTKDGRPARVLNALTPGTWHPDNNISLTSLPLAMATQAVLDGSVATSGVYWPDEIIDADTMFGEVARSLPARLPGDRLVDEVFFWLDQ